MQLTIEKFSLPVPRQQRVFQPYDRSLDLGDDGFLNFEYPIVITSEEELDLFLGDVVSGIGKAVGHVTKAIDKVVPISKVAKGVGDVASVVDKVVPVSLLVPGGPLLRFAGDAVSRIARGENVFKALEQAGTAAVGDVRKGLQLASTVASFVPGIGTGVAAALGAANALANGEPITDAVIAAARSAIPGGQIAQAAFDVAANLAKGKNLGDAMLDAARKRLPGGPLVQAAYDAGLALAKGQSLQQAALQATGRLLPKSPFAANALSFVNKAMSGQNIQTAALSNLGTAAYKKMVQLMPNQPAYNAALRLARSPSAATPGRAAAAMARANAAQAISRTKLPPLALGPGKFPSRPAAAIGRQSMPWLKPNIPARPSVETSVGPVPPKGAIPTRGYQTVGRGSGSAATQALFDACMTYAKSGNQGDATFVNGGPRAPIPPYATPPLGAASRVTSPYSMDLSSLPMVVNAPGSGQWLRKHGHVMVSGAYPQ